MYFENIDIQSALEDFTLVGATFPYNGFVVRLYNLCRSLGFQSGKFYLHGLFALMKLRGIPIF